MGKSSRVERLFKFMILLCINSGINSMELGMRGVPVESDVGREVVSSQVKTLEK